VLRGRKEVERESAFVATLVSCGLGVNRRAVRVRRRHYATFSCLRYQRVVELEAWQVKSPAFRRSCIAHSVEGGVKRFELVRTDWFDKLA
jgi:hypothetical protein